MHPAGWQSELRRLCEPLEVKISEISQSFTKVHSKAQGNHTIILSYTPKWMVYNGNLIKLDDILGGGNSNIFYFYPEPWGNGPIRLITNIFQMGWNHQLADIKTMQVETDKTNMIICIMDHFGCRYEYWPR